MANLDLEARSYEESNRLRIFLMRLHEAGVSWGRIEKKSKTGKDTLRKFAMSKNPYRSLKLLSRLKLTTWILADCRNMSIWKVIMDHNFTKELKRLIDGEYPIVRDIKGKC